MAETRVYNTELLKGTGLIQETIMILDIYIPGISRAELVAKAVSLNIMAKGHNTRIKDIVNRVFYRRFFSFGEETILALKQLRSNEISISVLVQILFIYTCRTNLILFDFIKNVFMPLVSADLQILPADAAKNFIADSIRNGIIEPAWSDSTKQRVARHMIATLTDFRLIDKNKNIVPFFLNDVTANYLIHDLHFNAYTDEAIATAEEWSLFGYDRYDTIRHLERLAIQGHFIFQNSGDLIRITWHYKNMKELIDAIR